MKVSQGDDLEGVLDISRRDFVVSRSAILSLDVRARGCPREFDPSRPTEQKESACSLQDVVHELLRHNLQNFRFIYVGEVTDGCRYWVWTALSKLKDAGFITRQDALTGPPDALPLAHQSSTASLWTILHQKWDIHREAEYWPLVPGLWLSPQRVDEQAFLRNL
ncbi:hypothetical protein CERZMDRAFT_99281 [Cercospora zeae-maydis SCOH1-5]|uniref:DUF7770 domain-containing protein n=1 Tax=Cercospora zeae-maydis SCOH1-5 TaxID=717836 RepID=A0A6A6FB85_9PEZI|nr:hypothetical protein CERZMDRAFT_99281 [Cercospora zeae-maydis SCOH1-5]